MSTFTDTLYVLAGLCILMILLWLTWDWVRDLPSRMWEHSKFKRLERNIGTSQAILAYSRTACIDLYVVGVLTTLLTDYSNGTFSIKVLASWDIGLESESTMDHLIETAYDFGATTAALLFQNYPLRPHLRRIDISIPKAHLMPSRDLTTQKEINDYWAAKLVDGQTTEKDFHRVSFTRDEWDEQGGYHGCSSIYAYIEVTDTDPIPEGSGYVYVLTNKSIPGMVKIGMATRDTDQRAEELSGATGVPTPFDIIYEHRFPDCAKAEKLIHQRLDAYRLPSKEFFEVEPRVAIATVIEIAKTLDAV